MNPRSEFFAGLRAQLPILLGVFPFGLIYGLFAREAGLPPTAAQAMSSVVFAGSSQIIATQLFGGAAPVLVIVVTTFVVNLRHALYSASVAPYVRPLSRGWKFLLAYLLTDEAYATTIVRYRDGDESPHRHWFFFGTGLTLWAAWQVSTALGLFVGGRIPEGWSLDFTLPLTFLALVATSLRDRPGVASALVAGVTAVAAAPFLPFKLWLIAAAFAGIATGMVLEARTPGRADAS